MIKESTIKQIGNKIPLKEVLNKISCKKQLAKICVALQKELGITNITVDKDFLYVMDERDIPKIAEKLNNRLWMQKIARHRVIEDCQGCKYLNEEDHLGKLWCDKWDTDIWNVSTPYPDGDNKVNQGCVPFRYFGYAPKPSDSQGLYRFNKVEAKLKKDSNLMNDFIEQLDLKEIGDYEEENIFVGQFDPVDRFGFKLDKEQGTLEMAINKGDEDIYKKYALEDVSFDEMMEDWREAWGLNYRKQASDPKVNAPRQDRSFDWLNEREYNRRNNPQKSERYDVSPSNIGDKYPEGNKFNDADVDVGNL